jgi:hypothetical protein
VPEPNLSQDNSSAISKVKIDSTTTQVSLSFGQTIVRSTTLVPTENGSKLTSKDLKRRKHRKFILDFIPRLSDLVPNLNITCFKDFGSWKFGLRAYSVIPYRSPVIEHCRQGRLEEVRKMLLESSASTTDVDPSGWTLLHVGKPRYIYNNIADTVSMLPFAIDLKSLAYS